EILHVSELPRISPPNIHRIPISPGAKCYCGPAPPRPTPPHPRLGTPGAVTARCVHWRRPSSTFSQNHNPKHFVRIVGFPIPSSWDSRRPETHTHHRRTDRNHQKRIPGFRVKLARGRGGHNYVDLHERQNWCYCGRVGGRL